MELDDVDTELEFSSSTSYDVSTKHEKVIIHIDIDCFYAQVETILNPSLSGKPLGIQQKNLVVTCNYEARQLGVQKLMSVKMAKDLCPSLILVNGEDLKKYREMSEKIYHILQTFSPYVEKLGLDENFIDVTNLTEQGASENVVGHVFGDMSENCDCGCKERLIKATNTAQEIRSQLKSELGISSCAGIAHNKLLAKLVGATHKPNQQTVLFPSSTLTLIRTLSSPRHLPGIGSSTSKKLFSLGLDTIEKVQNADLRELVRIFGAKMANQIKNLSLGIDESLVKITDKPKSIGAEDGFPTVRTVSEIQEKLENLLERVWELVVRDGRKPSQVKLTVRKLIYTPEKQNTRESRQSSINIDGNKIVVALDTASKSKIIHTLMNLFDKIVNNETGWQVTLLGISFSGLISSSSPVKNSLLKYFNSATSPTKPNVTSIALSRHQALSQEKVSQPPPAKRSRIDESVLLELPAEIREEILKDVHGYATSSPPKVEPSLESRTEANRVCECPDNVDPSVFSQLPPEIQQELLEETKRKMPPAPKKPQNLLEYFRRK